MGIFEFPFILIAVLSLVLILLLFFFAGNRKKSGGRLTPLASVGFGCMIAGIVFGENRWLGYSLMAAGVLFAIADAVLKMRKKG